ncbi:enterobactin synthetase component F [biofilm metagenome]
MTLVTECTAAINIGPQNSDIKDTVINYRPSWRVERHSMRDALAGESNGDAAVLVSSDNRKRFCLADERFHYAFERRCEWLGHEASRHPAVDYGEVAVTYKELRDRSNQLARFFEAHGIKTGDRIALLLDRSIDSYAVVLAASKLGAAYVPLDASFPAERVQFMLEDSAVSVVITLRGFTGRFKGVKANVIALDDCYDEIEKLSKSPFNPATNERSLDPLAYIIYTSGSTGRPKGVPIRHSSICNFINIASELYGYMPSDRVYQGMTIAFDFSIEELWVPLAAGATLVPAPSQAKLIGNDLADFLASRQVTALCCVPTLLATLEPDLPKLRLLLVSGEACPSDVIAKWLVPSRRVLNAYGPTETTVTATWSLVEPGKPITIGGPLPSYSVIIIDPDTKLPCEPGEAGEICIAGIGLCNDYLNHPDQTARAFIPDFLSLPDNPSRRLYRTGDLGRITGTNEIEYLGRIDTQVKIRGYRIELSEIESVARGVDGVEQVVVQPFDLDGNGTVLAAYVTPTRAGAQLDMTSIDSALRKALPTYMVPTYYDQLVEIPLLPSGKADRNALPPPSGRRFTTPDAELIEPRTAREGELALLLADILKREQVSVRANFFDDLGADSLSMAAYATAIRKQLGLRRVSMRQLYENPSIADLAIALDKVSADALAKKSVGLEETKPNEEINSTEPCKPVTYQRAADRHAAAPHIASKAACFAVGLAQVLVFAVFIFLEELAIIAAYHWVSEGVSLVDNYLRSVLATSGIFFGTSAVLIAVKWLAIGRFTTTPIPIWSLKYLRFWIARIAIQVNPMILFAGTPLYSDYLRLLGVRIGRGAIILANKPPICTDLVRIGANSVIRQDALFPAYTAKNGYLYPGTVTIGADTVICEATVLDIFTAVGDGTQLGSTSAVLEGQSIPAGYRYQGSPAEPSQANFDKLPRFALSKMREIVFSTMQLYAHCFVALPAVTVVAVLIFEHILGTKGLVVQSVGQHNIVSLALSAGVLYFGELALFMLVVLTVPRLLNLFVKPGVAHPLYGLQYELAHTISRISNNRLLNTIFGDSSMIVHWLSAVGYDLSRSTQTGSNFGVDQRHHNPFLCEFNRNTLVSDGLKMMNMETSSTAFILRKVTMPPDTYVGNLVHYPADSRLGTNCLIATKAALPVDGPLRTDVGLLGSPTFEIPRTVARDHCFDHFKQPKILKQRLAKKLRSNLVTLGLYMLRTWLLTTVGLLLGFTCLKVVDATALNSEILKTAIAFTVATMAFTVASALISILFENLACKFRRLKPLYCSLYDPLFWAHERFWKLNYNAFLTVFNGTPMKPFFLRLQGAKVGRGVFDDGTSLTEPSMVEIGDHCMLNYSSHLQCHSLEDGTFKSDRIKLGNRCTLATNAFVHYGTVMHDDTVLEADAFLMKGSVMEQCTRWLGNPAREASATNELNLQTKQGAKKW